jgi:chitin synthase
MLSCLMLYMIIASIECAIQAAQQGGTANSVMLLSIAVTYGCALITDPHHMLISLIFFYL